MEKINLIETIKSLFEKGENIIQYLRDADKRSVNTIEDILISYDFQAGSYVREYYNSKEFKSQYVSALADVINKLGSIESIIEVGVGEATTLGLLPRYLQTKPAEVLGFDLSWSRINFAREFVEEQGLKNTQLFTGDLFEIPLKDSSVDVVYTSHSLEPNGGNEKEALCELYRISRKFLVLLEPSYELAKEEAKARMIKHGYITRLVDTAKDLGYRIVEHRLFELTSNPLNPTGLLIIQVDKDKEQNSTELVCPVSKTPLASFDGNVLYSTESLLAYPVIKGIPCLLRHNAILATHFMLDYKVFREKM